jgi:RNA polymerase-binding transcription factor DksA
MRPDFEPIRQRLTTRLTELDARIVRIEGEQREPLESDFAEQAVAREDDEALDAIERAALAEIAQTRQALARLDAGTYGLCASCGDAIAPARLEALPAAALCIRCAGLSTDRVTP